MGFWKLLLRPWRHYVDFAGRSTRREYWLFKLTFYGVILAVGLSLGLSDDRYDSLSNASVTAFDLLLGTFILGAALPNWAVSARRLHDQGRTGLLILLTFIPYVGWIIMLIFGLIPGQREENEYGPDPRQPDGVAEDAALHEVFS